MDQCDGQRPCASCTHRNVACEYESAVHETRQGALKRKYQQVSAELDDTKAILTSLAKSDARIAENVFRRLRAGQSPQSIARTLEAPISVNSANALHERRSYSDFLVALSQSTASLPEMVHFAAQVLNNRSRISFPTNEGFSSLRKMIIDLEELAGIMDIAYVKRIAPRSAQHAQDPSKGSDGSHDAPLFHVEMNEHLPCPDIQSSSSSSTTTEHDRVRASIASTVVWVHT